jgi:hypothetical protein
VTAKFKKTRDIKLQKIHGQAKRGRSRNRPPPPEYAPECISLHEQYGRNGGQSIKCAAGKDIEAAGPRRAIEFQDSGENNCSVAYADRRFDKKGYNGPS